MGISESVRLALRGEGHQTEKGIDSAELILKKVSIYSSSSEYEVSLLGESMLKQYVRHSADAFGMHLECGYLHAQYTGSTQSLYLFNGHCYTA